LQRAPDAMLKAMSPKFASCRGLPFVLAFVALSCFPLFAQDRGLSVLAKTLAGDESFDVGKQFAVIIGIDKYKEWPGLSDAVSEAKSIRSILAKRYYVDEFFELYDQDATASNIRSLFLNTLPAKVGLKDSLLVFYAGHGYLDASKTGFWIACDGAKDELDQSGWIPNAQLRNLIGNLKSQRTLVLADACFSGDFLDLHRGAAPTVNSEYFKKALRLTARQVLTSGASESVPDSSEFGHQLLNLLERNTEPYLDPLSMYERIRLGVTKTQPLFGTLPGNEAGASFVLFLKDTPSSSAVASSGEPGGAGSEAVSPVKTPSLSVVPKTYGTALISSSLGGTLALDGVILGDIGAGTSVRVADVETGSHSFELQSADGRRAWSEVTVEADGEVLVSLEAGPELGQAILVQGGSFTMGSASSDDDERPVHTVRISDFWMMNTEVTQDDYLALVGTNPSHFVGPRLPVDGVSWYDAVVYANRLSDRDGLKKVYSTQGPTIICDWSANGWRLPTEAEWEFAASGRAASGRAATGETGSPSAGEGTVPVGSSHPNELGLYDLFGNVFEWCWDWYGAYESSSQIDPRGPNGGSRRITRGGGWQTDASKLRSSYRSYGSPEYSSSLIGFRLVRSAR